MFLRNQKIAYFFAILILGVMLAVFWTQEWKYLLPTPVPRDYQAILPNTRLDFDTLAIQKVLDKRTKPKPVFLHFFSPTCPCSAYNIAHFKHLVDTYKHQVDFYAVLFADLEGYDSQKFNQLYGVNIPVITQQGIDIAMACGSYSTPQATIIKEGRLYYRGNYNRSRYCSNKNTNFAEIALQELLAGKPAPVFEKAATMAYGCELPQE